MKINLIFILFFSNLYFSQIKVNNNDSIKIIFPFENVKYSLGANYLFTIKNDSNYDYLIDTYPNSFLGRVSIYKNREYLQQKLVYPEGYPAEREYDECKKDFEIIKKGRKKNIILPVFQYNGTYELDKNNSYEIVISKQIFGKQISGYLGCKKYIEEMEKKKYKILEGEINLKLKLIE